MGPGRCAITNGEPRSIIPGVLVGFLLFIIIGTALTIWKLKYSEDPDAAVKALQMKEESSESPKLLSSPEQLESDVDTQAESPTSNGVNSEPSPVSINK